MFALPVFDYYHRKNHMRIIRRQLRNAYDPFAIPEERFIELYRLPQSIAMRLIDILSAHIEDGSVNTGVYIQPCLQILSVLNFYASGSYQRRVGMDNFCAISQTKISIFVRRISGLIVKHMSGYVQFPCSEPQLTEAQQKFEEKTKFPKTVGLIDGTQIAVSGLPADKEYAFVNRKGWHSINVQIICDERLKILNMNARYPGSTHDAYIWANCMSSVEIEKMYRTWGPFWLLGDSGYPLQPWLITPFRNPNNEHKEKFNKMHTSVRCAVERCIGLLKNRFRCLHKEKKLRYSHETAADIIYACGILHNFLLDIGYSIEEVFVGDHEIQSEPSHEVSEGGNRNRQYLVNYFRENL